MMSIRRLLEKVVPDPEDCLQAARELRDKRPHETPEELARRAIWHARQSAVAVGALTGAASNPLIMIPAAIADMGAMLRLEGVMVGTIAALLDPDSMTQSTLESDIVTVLFPGAVSQVMRQVGVRVGEQATKSLIRKRMSEEAATMAVKVASKHLGMRVTRNAIIEKTVPLVGAGIGAGWNWLEIGAVGNRAIQYFKGEPMILPGRTTVASAMGKARSAFRQIGQTVRRKLPMLPAPATRPEDSQA